MGSFPAHSLIHKNRSRLSLSDLCMLHLRIREPSSGTMELPIAFIKFPLSLSLPAPTGAEAATTSLSSLGETTFFWDHVAATPSQRDPWGAARRPLVAPGGDLRLEVASRTQASIHKGDEVNNVFKEKGFIKLYVPPYSPWFNPIEGCFSIVKRYPVKQNLRPAFGRRRVPLRGVGGQTFKLLSIR